MRGLAFTLFEGMLSPVDWAVSDIRGSDKNTPSLEAAKRLMDRWHPEVVVLADGGDGFGRAPRIQRLRHLIRNHAEGQSVDVVSFNRAEVQACFESVGAKTRYEIAQAIASRIPAFANRLPPAPNQWTSRHARMALFDAAALALTFYSRLGESLTAPGPREGRAVDSDPVADSASDSESSGGRPRRPGKGERQHG
jgi:hypothetical protein